MTSPNGRASSQQVSSSRAMCILCLLLALAGLLPASMAAATEADDDPGPAISAQAVMYGNHRILPAENEASLARRVEMQNMQIQQLSKQLKEMPRMIESKVGPICATGN